MKTRSRLPGGPRRSSRLVDPWVATPLLALLALLLSSLQVPPVDRWGRDALAASLNPPPDSVSVQVTPAFRAEFFPTEGKGAVRRSRLYRIEVSFWSIAPPDRLTLVVGNEPADPTLLASMMRAERADGISTIRTPHREPGAPIVHDASGWSAWDVALRPAPNALIDGDSRDPDRPDTRQRLDGAISVDSATVATLGPWVGLFDDEGRRIGMTQIPSVVR